MKNESINHEPLYLQIAKKIQLGILTGQYLPDALIPSVREFAIECGVNPNTVAKSYQYLQSQGFVYFDRGKGLRVAANLQNKLENLQTDQLRLKIDELIDLSHHCKVSKTKLIELIQSQYLSKSTRSPI